MKIKRLFKLLKKGSINGVSTGFFSILYALNESNHKVIISGIGMEGGGHYYNKILTDTQIEQMLIKIL